MIRLSIIAMGLILLVTMAAAATAWPVPQEQTPQPDDETITLPEQDPDSISRRDFMRTKLMYSQNIFEGLTTGDFNTIETAVKEVQMVTEGEQWVAIDNDQYRKLTEEFKTSTRRLAEAAKSKNLDATALRFYAMSNSCIDCHKHIRRVGYDF